MATIKAGEINLEYHIEGSGPPLLLIMGFGGQASSWGEPFLRGLRPHFTTVRFSNRGTGASDRPDAAITVPMMAEDAANLLDALGIGRPHVLGVSMGGMIAQELVLNHPQQVNGLVLGCTTPGVSRGVAAGPEVVTMLVPTPGLAREDQVRKMWPAICSPSFVEAANQFLEEMLASGLKTPTPMDTIMKQMVAIQSFDAYERLPRIEQPTLVIHGDRDVLVPPENGRIIAGRIPGAELRIIEDAAHMFFWEKTEESASQVVEFLSRVPAGSP
jgi:3-oxoadipate enol-lactonase